MCASELSSQTQVMVVYSPWADQFVKTSCGRGDVRGVQGGKGGLRLTGDNVSLGSWERPKGKMLGVKIFMS